MALPEFPPRTSSPVVPFPASPESICAALAPSIQSEAEMTELLSQVGEGPKRDAIEACLREHGACRSVAGTT